MTRLPCTYTAEQHTYPVAGLVDGYTAWCATIRNEGRVIYALECEGPADAQRVADNMLVHAMALHLQDTRPGDPETALPSKLEALCWAAFNDPEALALALSIIRGETHAPC